MSESEMVAKCSFILRDCSDQALFSSAFSLITSSPVPPRQKLGESNKGICSGPSILLRGHPLVTRVGGRNDLCCKQMLIFLDNKCTFGLEINHRVC